MQRSSLTPIRRLTVAQGLAVADTTVDLTLTGIVGARLAPTSGLATLPYASIFLTAGISTAFVSRALSRFPPRRVFTVTALAAALSGLVSALGVQLGSFWLFCAGTALVGIYTAGAAYYRYLAAESMPNARARAVSTVLSGGLVAAIVGPFLATALRGMTSTPFVGSYLLVAALGTTAAIWNSRLPTPSVTSATDADAQPDAPRSRRALWSQPHLWLGLIGAMVAMGTMSAMMTAGPILGEGVGHSAVVTALAVQLHMIGMYAPGFLVARIIGRIGEARVLATGAVLICGAGAMAFAGTSISLFLGAMLLVGVGWNLAYSGGSALISTAYQSNERARVQTIAEPIIVAAQVAGAFSATAFTTVNGWFILGVLSLTLGATAIVLTVALAKRPMYEQSGRQAEPS